MAKKEFIGGNFNPEEIAEFIGYVCVLRVYDMWWVGTLMMVNSGEYNQVQIRMTGMPNPVVTMGSNSGWSIESFR